MTEEIRQLEYDLEMAGLLPEHPPTDGERRHQLSRQDLLALAMINRRTATAPCSIGLTSEQGVLLKRMLCFVDRTFSLVGMLTVTAIVGGLFTIVGLGVRAWLKAAGK
jgi:hypothetical protein